MIGVPAAAPVPAPAAEPRTSGNFLSGLVVKFGIRAIGRDGRYGSVGYDRRIGRFLALGVELLPTASQFTDDVAKVKESTIQANGFINIKAGTSLGIFSPAWDFVRVYAGAGGGAMLLNSKLTVEGTSASLTQTVLATHILVGFELKMKSWALVFEYQALAAFQPHYSSNPWLGFCFFGVRL